MSPILGIWASQNYPRITNSYESIATINAGGTTTATFSSIPNTFKHLQIRMLVRTSRNASDGDYVLMTFNSDSSSSYVYDHVLRGNGSTVTSYSDGTSATGIILDRFTSLNAPANIFGVGIIDILDYQNTNKYKTTRGLVGNDTNSASYNSSISFESGLWMKTSAIDSITLFASSNTNYATGTQFALYGIK